MRLVGIPVRALISSQNAAVMAAGHNELMDWISTHTLVSVLAPKGIATATLIGDWRRAMGHPAVRVKICGVRRAEDARMAAELGADAIGVLVGQRHPSGDFISAEQATAVLQVLPNSVCGVSAIRRARPDLLLHKAVHVGSADGFVADSFNSVTGQVGGTGLTHDWRLTTELARSAPALAGGLTPQNVAEASAQVQAYGVDVNSGVKGNDGFKNLQRLQQAFIRSAGSGTSS